METCPGPAFFRASEGGGRSEIMIKAVFTYDYGDEKMEQVRALGYEILLYREKNLEFSPEMADAEVLVCYAPFKTLDIGQMAKLRWIQLSSIGVDQVPIEKAKEKRLTISNNRGGYSVAMGEWIVLKILEIYKQSKFFYKNQLQHTWQLTTDILELCGKRIGFIGTGTIAQEAAKRLKGFNVSQIGFNTTGKAVHPFDECFPISMLDRWIQRFDILVLAVPATAGTHRLISRSLMRKMKDSAILINVSRGSVLDEQALLEQLQAGKFLGVALDVFEQEPLSPENPFWDIERAYITPHNCWVSEQRNERRFDIILENLRRYSQKQELLNQVDLDRGY